MKCGIFAKAIRVRALGAAGLLLAAIAGLQAQPGAARAPGPLSPVPLQPSVTDLNYPIAPGDIIRVTVFQEDDLKSLLRVSQEGDITFPLVGIIPVKGLSTAQAAQAIAARLRRGYLINPQVTVTVMEFAKHRFTVLGEVQKPGAYDLPDQQHVSLLQAIGMAGGYTNIADPRKVTLIRKIDGRQRTFHFDARKMAEGDAESSFTVHTGDVITVGESFF